MANAGSIYIYIRTYIFNIYIYIIMYIYIYIYIYICIIHIYMQKHVCIYIIWDGSLSGNVEQKTTPMPNLADLWGTPDRMNASERHLGCDFLTRFSSREVRLRVPFSSVVYLGEPSPKKETVRKSTGAPS